MRKSCDYLYVYQSTYICLLQEKIIGCYELIQEIVSSNNQRNAPKVLPQLRVTARTRRWSTVSSLSSSPSSSSSPSFSLSYKKRKLNSCFWVDVDKGNSEWREKKQTRIIIKEQEEIRWARLSRNLNIFKRVFAMKIWLYVVCIRVWWFWRVLVAVLLFNCYFSFLSFWCNCIP